MKTALIIINDQEYMIGTLSQDQHDELWFRRFLEMAPEGASLEFINKVSKMTVEDLEREGFDYSDYQRVLRQERIDWSIRKTYLFKVKR